MINEYGRRLAHEVILENKNVGDELFKVVTDAIDAPDLTPGERWKRLRAAEGDMIEGGLSAIASSELDPAWVRDELTQGNVEGVIAVAGTLDAAKKVRSSLDQAFKDFVRGDQG